MSIFNREQIRQLIKEYNLKNTDDIQSMLKDLFGETIQEMLEAEMDEHLGYSKYEYDKKETDNTRNGYSKKKVNTEYGKLDILTPRDRKSEFDPIIVKKGNRDISTIEDKIISMYAKGMTVRDIQDHLNDLYGVDASATLISRITDKVMPLITEWQNRPLEEIYCIVFMDAIHFKVKQDGSIINKAAYMAIGINLEGKKDVLGIWIGENESSKYWLNVLNEIKNRGVKDILIASIDGLKGFSEAIKATFPETDIQKCIIHQIRNSTKFLSYKDRKEFCNDLKKVYKAATEEAALVELDKLEEKWGYKYIIAIKSWRSNWDELATMFRYPQEIRKIIYTTNIIESYHRQLRKVTKSKSIFPTDESLQKMLYLATMDITKKWTSRQRNWPLILGQLSIFFEERLSNYLF